MHQKRVCAWIIFAGAMTACSGATPPTVFSPSGVNRLATSAAISTRPQHVDRSKSWFAPQIKSKTPILFVSDAGTADVYLYELPTLKLVGTVTGFAQPQGECSDNKGDVWVTDANASTIYELSHAGRLEGRLSDATGYPDGCAWDPTTGNLAVTNLFGHGSTGGAVLIYPSGSGSPAAFTNDAQYFYNFAGYDGKGNLFFDGRDSSGAFVLSELAKGAGSAHTLSVTGGTIHYPGLVQWSGSYLDVGDQDCGGKSASCIYQLSISENTAKVKSRVRLRSSSGGQVCDFVQGVIDNQQILGSDNDYCGSTPSATYAWPYPAGGNPTASNDKVDSAPIGATVSTAQIQNEKPHRDAWMDASAKKSDLLYISDGNGEVTVYTYWKKTIVGELTDFTQPMGECVDKSGDVFVADFAAKQIVEYPHAGTKPIKKLNDAPYNPYSCSVDLTSGALAVANESGGPSGQGNIAIYANAGGTPTIYTDQAIANFESCAYDGSGNLLATNGEAGSRGYSSFAWLPANGNHLINAKVPGTSPSWQWQDVQGIQWDGKYWAIDEYNLYRVTLMNGQFYYVGVTEPEIFENNGPYWIYNNNPAKQGTQVVGATDGSIDYWPYPAGGYPIGQIYHGIDDPYGVTVSLGKTHH